jgi:MFS family permease
LDPAPEPEEEKRMPPATAPEHRNGRDLAWLQSLGFALPLQIVASFATQIVVVIGPVMADAAGIPPASVGVIAACVSTGTLIFLVCGIPFLKRYGVFPTLMTGLVVCAAGLAASAIAWWPAMLMAAVLLGIGYGPVPPSGSRVLARSAPARHRSLIFSIKQAGAPFGTAIASLLMPILITAFDWQTALWISAGATLLFAVTLLPFRTLVDAGEGGDRRIRLSQSFNMSLFTKPVSLLSKHRELRGVSAMAIAFALGQGIVFANFIVFLVETGYDFASASTIFAACQIGGVSARLLVGWIADRVGTAAGTLRIQAVLAALALLIFAWSAGSLPFEATAALAFLLGSLVASWNGLYLAEVARLVTLEEVPEATAAATTAIFIAYAFGPLCFSGILLLSGHWTVSWSVLSAVLLIAAVFKRRLA